MASIHGFITLLIANGVLVSKSVQKDLGMSSKELFPGHLPDQVEILPCAPGEEASIEILFPRDHQTLDIRADFSIGRNLLIRSRATNFRFREDGHALWTLSSFGADPQSLNFSKKDDWRTHEVGDAGKYRILLQTNDPNFEMFGLTQGRYLLHVTLVDSDQRTRSCWKTHSVYFTVGEFHAKNRSETLLRGLERIRGAGRRMSAATEPWLVQPQGHKDFAFVTVLWSDDYVDAVMAWAAGLIAVGSTFGRLCMVVRALMWDELLDKLQRCCCDIVDVEPIQSPWKATRGASRYELALTKLRVLQLADAGYRKVVLMDSDILVLQNIDELFWFPAPAATVSASTLLGEQAKPRLSTGVMVLEPSEEEFQGVMRRLQDWEENAGEQDSLRFIEQDLLDMHWTADGRVKYHVLPLIYNLYPELLDTFPFLAPEPKSDDQVERMWAKYPVNHGVKLVHFWHWYNPAAAIHDRAKAALQTQAKLKHPQMWYWYELWWDLHQRGVKASVPDKYESWITSCKQMMLRKYNLGEDVASNFVPTAMGTCVHRRGGLEW